MASILILSFSKLDSDPRVSRQIKSLLTMHNIVAVGFSCPRFTDVLFIKADTAKLNNVWLKAWDAVLLKLRFYNYYYWKQIHVQSVISKLKGYSFDLIIANDLNTLPIAFKVSGGKSKIVFDAHEYFPREFEDKFIWRNIFKRYTKFFCQKYIPKVNAMMTVCEGISNEYEKNFNVKPVVITNAPEYHDLKPSRVKDNVVRMIHHGAAIPSRKLELMIELMDVLDERFYLDFMLVGSEKYISKLKVLASKKPRVQFLPPVDMEKLPMITNAYDVGLFLLPPTNFNYEMALPNKFFEYIQARLCIAIGPSGEMQRFVKKYDCGVIASNFSPHALAEMLNNLTFEKLTYYKNRSDEAARDLCFSSNSNLLLELVNNTLSE